MTEVTVRIPGPLRPFTDGEYELRVAAGTVAELIGRIGERHPQVPPRLLTPDGHLRPYVNLFVGQANVRGLQGLGTVVEPGAIVSIIPAVAGG
jgi:molybdopterin converting factor small subunit